MTGGSWTRCLRRGPDDGLPGIVIGAALAETLGVADGDEVTVLTPPGHAHAECGGTPGRAACGSPGVSLGLFEFDSAYGFVSLPLARRLLDRASIDVIELRVDDIYRAGAVAAAIPQAPWRRSPPLPDVGQLNDVSRVPKVKAWTRAQPWPLRLATAWTKCRTSRE